MFCIVLYCFVLYCIVLLLYCVVLYLILLYRAPKILKLFLLPKCFVIYRMFLTFIASKSLKLFSVSSKSVYLNLWITSQAISREYIYHSWTWPTHNRDMIIILLISSSRSVLNLRILVFPLRFMGMGKKHSVCNLQYGPGTWSVRGIYMYI